MVVVLFVLNLFVGSVRIPAEALLRILTGGETEHAAWRFIVLESRLPQALTATLCGASLAVSGLMLQTAFRNPLAGPDIFGISSGVVPRHGIGASGGLCGRHGRYRSHLFLRYDG